MSSTPFQPAPLVSFTFCRQILHAVGQLRRGLRARYLGAGTPGAALLRRSLAEAEALAWETSFPHLFLPLLAEEKVRFAQGQSRY